MEPEAAPLPVAPECNPAHDKPWAVLPDTALAKTAPAANAAENERRRNAMHADRVTCWSGLIAQQKG